MADGVMGVGAVTKSALCGSGRPPNAPSALRCGNKLPTTRRQLTKFLGNGCHNMQAQSQSTSEVPVRQIRAIHDERTIRVYQAYSDAIADSALAQGTFVSPPFKMDRMTWIKPSFLWMMYRAGWGMKDPGQARILAIDISREGFEWALTHSCPSHPGESMTKGEWLHTKENSPVRIQWDPERDLHLQPQTHRSIQIGLSKQAVDLYAQKWIQRISDVTPLAHRIHKLIRANTLNEARLLLPQEVPYAFDLNQLGK